MTRTHERGRPQAAPRHHRPIWQYVAATLAMALALVAPIAIAQQQTQAAATPLTVAEASATQDGAEHSVTGVIVGQPVSSDNVVTSDFSTDYAVALADSGDEQSTDAMVYVQLPSELRSQWGLQSNPDLLGSKVTVTGTLTAYYSHAGVKDTTAIVGDDSTTDPTDPTDTSTTSTDTPTTTPTTSTPTDVPDGYYDPAEGKSGEELKTALHEIIDDNDQLSYDALWDALCETDVDPENSGNVIEVYTGNSISCSDHGSGADQWNREHVWAKSHGDFGTATGPGTDLHHIRPADMSVNSTRNNLDFDEGGEEVEEAPGNFYDSDSFEPRDEMKGDVARMILYMDVRYNGDDGFADLEANDEVGNESAPHIGKISMLIKWSNEDPPSAFEQHRNDVIYSSFQHNRNPFIDHPEWVDAIYSGALN